MESPRRPTALPALRFAARVSTGRMSSAVGGKARNTWPCEVQAVEVRLPRCGVSHKQRTSR